MRLGPSAAISRSCTPRARRNTSSAARIKNVHIELDRPTIYVTPSVATAATANSSAPASAAKYAQRFASAPGLSHDASRLIRKNIMTALKKCSAMLTTWNEAVSGTKSGSNLSGESSNA